MNKLIRKTIGLHITFCCVYFHLAHNPRSIQEPCVLLSTIGGSLWSEAEGDFKPLIGCSRNTAVVVVDVVVRSHLHLTAGWSCEEGLLYVHTHTHIDFLLFTNCTFCSILIKPQAEDRQRPGRLLASCTEEQANSDSRAHSRRQRASSFSSISCKSNDVAHRSQKATSGCSGWVSKSVTFTINFPKTSLKLFSCHKLEHGLSVLFVGLDFFTSQRMRKTITSTLQWQILSDVICNVIHRFDF